MQREIEFDKVINKLTDEELISKEELSTIYEYIDNLKEEIDDLESQVNNLECDLEEAQSEVSSLQDEINEERNYQCLELLGALEEITDDRYLSHKSYDTKEKILERLEYILKYGV